jgi:HEAT repeat protein
VLRQVFLFLQAFPKEAEIRKTVNAWLTREEIQPLLKGLFEECRTYDSKEMAAISAISQLFPEKTTGFLIDRLAAHGSEDNPQRRWLLSALAGMGENLLRPLSQRLRSASEKELPQLILLAETSMNANLASALQELLSHKEQEIRVQTISALAHLKAESAVPLLAGLLREKTWLAGKKTRTLQMHAARALAEIGTPKANSVLQETAKRGSGELQELCQQLLSS